MQQSFSFFKKINENAAFYFLWTLTFAFLISIAVILDGTYDTGDGVVHYLMSRFCFKHPELLLDLWGKPIFTLVSAPFSQFGMKGITVFNIICGMLSALCSFKIAKLMQLKYAWTVLFFCIFAPIYFGVLNSGLTEPLFSLLLVFSILKAFEGKHLFAAFIFSLAPFVRPEANFLIPVFAFYFLITKNFKAIPMLLAGTVIFSLIGYIHFGDILWLKTHSPYSAANSEKYGTVHGDFLNYIGNYDHIIGYPLTILFVTGCLFLLSYPFIKKKIESSQLFFFREEVLLVYTCLFACIVVHTIVWWKGIFPTLGLWRYMSDAVPLAAILCLRGLNFIFMFLKNILIQYAVVIIMFIWICSVPFREYYFPFTLDPEQSLVKQSSDWFLKTSFTKNTIYPSHPSSILMLNLDPYDAKQTGNCGSIHADHPGDGVPSKSIIIWDAHYGAHDNNLPVKCFLESSDYTLLQKFVPQFPFNVFGNTPFEIYIFQRN